MKKAIIIDAGHGGKDPGASGHGHVEKNEALIDAKELKQIIESNYDNVDVVLTRGTDKFVGINKRKNFTNEIALKYGIDNVAFISLHWNSFKLSTATGWEAWVNYFNTKGHELAKSIEREVRPILNIPNRSIKQSRKNIGVLRANPATVLVEACFIANKNDINAYIKNRTNVLTAYAKGLANYLNLPKKKAPVQSDKLHKVQVGAYLDRENADIKLDELLADGFDGFIKLPHKDNLFRVQTGAFRKRKGAYDLLGRLEEKGHKGFIVIEEKESNPIPAEKKSKFIQIGDAKIIKTTPDNIYIPVLGDTIFKGWHYGVNGTFFDTKTAPVSSPNSCVYIAKNNGKAISGNAQFNGWNGPPRGTIHYTKNGILGNRRVKSVNELPKNTDWAIGGVTIKPYMQFKEEKVGYSITYKTDHTYIGYDKKGYLYLIVKPNHRPSEIVPVLDKLKITQAIMLDGGGSSQFNHEGGTIRSNRKINTAVLLKTK